MQFRPALHLFLTVLVSTGAALAQRATTTTTVTSNLSLPVVGLASSETAEVDVVNVASASHSGTAASCTGTITFYNASGAGIGSATSFTTGTGDISSATLPFSDTGASGRTTIRAVVALTDTPGAGVPCDLAYSLETYDSGTGVTHVHVGGSGLVPAALAGILAPR